MITKNKDEWGWEEVDEGSVEDEIRYYMQGDEVDDE